MPPASPIEPSPDAPVLPEAPAGPSIADRLLKERHALLDLSTRNRLLNTPLRTRNNRVVEIVDEKAAEVFRLLNDGKALTFLPGEGQPEDDAETDDAAIPQPGDDAVDERGVALRHSDSRLQTRLTSEGLQKRLFDIWDDARTLESEQGVNILYLALGLLRWYDADDSDVVRHAPLVLLPVQLERSSAADRFRLKGRDEPPSPNLTLQARMKADFGLVIDDFGDEDEVDLNAYAARIAETVAGKKRWQVLPDAMVLGFFSFAKFLMYRDLDPDNWPQDANGIGGHPLVTALLRDGFPDSPPLVADDADIDAVISPLELQHVVDADSSQAMVIAEAAHGRTLVVKGPPGTGKSQTITNIIAAAVARGKTVLFVAEKMAALDVVHRRLKQAGLGPLALELHSNKIAKRAVLEDLRQTRDMAARPLRDDLSVIQRLADVRGELNGFAERLHAPLVPSGVTPHAVLGRLAAWSAGGEPGRDIRLDGAETWTAEAVAQRRGLAEEIVERLGQLGAIAEHPWRGVAADPLDPAETDAVRRDIAAARDAIAEARRQAAVATCLLGAPEPRTMGDLDRALAFLQLTPLPREADRAALGDDAWRNTKALEGLIAAGKLLCDLRERAGAAFNAAGLSADLGAIRTDIVTKGDNLFRFLDGGYKRNIALLRSYVTGALPNDPKERLRLVDLVIHLQQAEEAFAKAEASGRAFGRLWQGAGSNWDGLDNILGWRTSHGSLPAEVWPKLAALPDAGLAEADAARQALYAATTEARRTRDAVLSKLVLDWPEPDLDAVTARFDTWLGDMEGLSRYIAFASRGRQLAALGAVGLVEHMHDGAVAAAQVLATFDGAYAIVLRDALFRAWPDLKAFDGEGQNRRVAQFRQLDTTRIGLAQDQIAARHAEDRPKGNAGIGPLGVLNAEMAKKRSHLPIRVLLDKAGPAIQQLKPVFMMSPLSVAQFLKPGALDFDLLVMDEASQIEPVDALGAVARVKQLVVVGDERQLPPTAFFKTLTGAEDEPAEDDITIQARDAESILDLCLAKGAPYRLLSWHYRSKHQSLIAVSNREFYGNRLFIVPSPYDAVAGMGLKFHLLTDAPYDRGGTRTNPKEARIVAEAVMAHARTNPEQSLGVAAFSVSQRQCILKELESLRRANPALEDFFAPDAVEPFFVKNLENIQGDERDVIFISMGYGKTADGNLAHSFGPLSGEGGERRLNVLISRAKLRCEVFSNFSGSDIDLERTPARGVAALKMFLTFAETGRFGEDATTGDGQDGAFEAEVARRLRGLGYDVKARIGASGFRVDLAVADPDQPGRFVLGIECDGAQYRDSRSARDRDRLRQQVLEAHGWILHRIWAADWYLRPKDELRRLEAAIAAARADWKERDEAGYAAQRAVPLAFEIEGATVTAVVGPPAPVAAATTPYVEAAFAVDRRLEPTDLPLVQLTEVVTRIVAAEGPVHGDEVTARLRQLWDLPRIGPRFKAAAARALTQAVASGQIAGGPFYTVPDQPLTVRDRSQVASAGLRKPDMLPPEEIDLAAITIVTENFGAARDELVTAVARQFGFSSTGAQLRTVLEARIAALVDSGALVAKGDLLTVEGG